MKERINKACLFAGVLLLAVTTLFPACAQEQKRDGWTVMVYMVGTSDLGRKKQNYLTMDLREMQSSVREDTTLLVMAGGPASRNNECLSEGSGLYQITRQEIRLLSKYEESMVDPGALNYLLRTGMESARGPAALILWDHGYGAMDGFGNENREDKKRLTMVELGEAFQTGLDGNRLELVGFDACMMACAETALAVAPYADYLVASQAVEPGEGWDYSFLSSLAPDVRGDEAGRIIIQSFAAHYDQKYTVDAEPEYPYTLSLVRLDGTQALSAATDGFLKELHKQMIGNGDQFSQVSGVRESAYVHADVFSQVSRARNSTYAFGRNETVTEYDLIDLGQFAGLFLQNNRYAQDVLDELNKCVEYREGNVPNAHGLSLYFPQMAAKNNRARWNRQVEELPLGTEWKSFLAEYETWLDAVRAEKYITKQEDGLTVQLDDELMRDFLRAKYFVLEETPDGAMRLLYAGNDYTLQDHAVTIPYHDQTLVFHTKDEDCPLVAFYIQEDEQSAYYQSTIITVQEDSPKLVRLRIKYDKEKEAWRVLSAFDISDEMVTGRQEIYLDEQTEVWIVNYFYRPVNVLSGHLLPFTKWETLPYPDISFLNQSGEYSLTEEPFQRKEGCRYWLQIVVVDTYQTEYASPLFEL